MSAHIADLWETEASRAHCRLCPNDCRIAEGRTGVCGVRRNVEGQLIAETYGRVSSAAVDPIEKKPVFHYRPGTLAFSIGSVGCSMRCGHCQNWQISRANPDDGPLSLLPPEDVPVMARRHGCEGVAFTYNEPVIWAEYVRDAAKAAKAAGLYTVMVTNGYVTPEGLDYLGDSIDVWRVDVKGFSDETYRKLCHVPHVAPVLQQAERAKSTWGMHVEVVTNVVPTVNDDEATIRGIAGWIRDALGPDTPWHITRFFPYLEMSHLPATPLPTLRWARVVGREEGLSFVFLGNVDEPGGEDTACPQCGKVLIERNGFLVDRDGVSPQGHCPDCGRDLGIVK